MSSVGGRRLNRGSTIATVSVPAYTLSSLIDANHLENIDLLSLDTEGYELEVLKGLNIDVNRPKYLLIEVYSKDFDELYKFLDSHDYELLENFTNYTKKTNPLWDGTHNDYLFKDKRI